MATVTITDDGASIKLVQSAIGKTISIAKPYSVDTDGTNIIIKKDGKEYSFLFSEVTSPVLATAELLRSTIEGYLETSILGSVGGFTSKIAFAPTTSSGAYTANDNIGGIITLTNLLRISGGTGLIDTISLWLLNNAAPNLYIDFWNASPSGTFTNDSAQVIAGDQLKWLGLAEVLAADWRQTGVISRCTINPPKFGIKGVSSANIYMTIQDKTGITLGSTSGMFGAVTLLQD